MFNKSGTSFILFPHEVNQKGTARHFGEKPMRSTQQFPEAFIRFSEPFSLNLSLCSLFFSLLAVTTVVWVGKRTIEHRYFISSLQAKWMMAGTGAMGPCPLSFTTSSV
jgi:hypothetical protein